MGYYSYPYLHLQLAIIKILMQAAAWANCISTVALSSPHPPLSALYCTPSCYDTLPLCFALLCFHLLCFHICSAASTLLEHFYNRQHPQPPVALMPSIPFSAVKWYFLFERGGLQLTETHLITHHPHHIRNKSQRWCLSRPRNTFDILKLLLLRLNKKA